MNEQARMYLAHMRYAKNAFRSIDRILGAKKSRTISEALDLNVCWLQLRMIVETVAFAGISADQERYAALRAEAKDNPDYTQDYKAGPILRRLEKITPHFLPVPIESASQHPESTAWHFQRGKEREHIDRFIAIHERAGYALHAVNPFGPANTVDYGKKMMSSRDEIKKELAYLKGILWNHIKVGLEFDGVKATAPGTPMHAWVVDFMAADSSEVRMVLAKAIP